MFARLRPGSKAPVWRAPVVAAAVLWLSASGSASPQHASRPADEWVKMLESNERLAGLKIDEVVAGMKLRPGEVIADLGAGSGLFVVPLARAVGVKGKVYAVDIDRAFFP